MKQLALANLSMLGVPPPQYIKSAAQAGFTHVGIRLLPASPAEIRHDLTAKSSLLSATKQALAQNSIEVLDVEALNLDGVLDAETWLPMLEVAAELGATVLNVIGSDPERSRLVDSFGDLARTAEFYGIQASLEPISYQTVSSVTDAAEIISQVGRGGIMLDTLHFQRGGSTLDELATVNRELFTVIQLSDGPESPRTDITVPHNDPMGQTGETSPRIIESRVQRDVPGSGVFPLHEIIETLGAKVPISVEVPNHRMIETLGADAYAKHLYAHTQQFLVERTPVTAL